MIFLCSGVSQADTANYQRIKNNLKSGGSVFKVNMKETRLIT